MTEVATVVPGLERISDPFSQSLTLRLSPSLLMLSGGQRRGRLVYERVYHDDRGSRDIGGLGVGEQQRQSHAVVLIKAQTETVTEADDTFGLWHWFEEMVQTLPWPDRLAVRAAVADGFLEGWQPTPADVRMLVEFASEMISAEQYVARVRSDYGLTE